MSFGVEQWKCVSHCVFTGMVAEGLPREGPCFRESAQECSESSIGGKMRKKLKAAKLVTKMRSEKCASDCSGTLICQKNEALGVAEKSALYTLHACWPIWHDAPATREIAGRTWRWQNALARLWGGRCHSRCQTYWNSWGKRIGLHELKEEVERGRYISEQKRVREVAERRGTSEKLWLRDWVAQSLID
jgi:hypothetical protein